MTSTTFTASLLIASCLFITVFCDVPAPIIKSLRIESNIKYTYAKTLVTSKILNPASVSQEVNFRVVLPEEAFITGFVMTIKGKPYEAYIKEKEEAKKDYEAAVSAGQSAGHISQTSSRYSKDFTVSVNVEAREKVNFNLTYEELLPRTNRTYKCELNINPNQIVPSLSIIFNIEDLLNITNVEVPQFKMTNEIVQHETENPNVKKEIISPNKVRVEWSPTREEQKELNAVGLNGQMIVKYDVDASKNPQQIIVDQDGYFVHIFRNDDLPVLNKHVVFILDVSGSMSGNKIDQLKQAMEKILSDLTEHDYFSIVLFSAKLLPWKTEGVDLQVLKKYHHGPEPDHVPLTEYYITPANKSNIDLALKFIRTLSTYGATNINGALRVGIGIAELGQRMFQNSATPIEPMIIFLTDGEPNIEESDPNKITENVAELNTKRATIFSLALGDDADMTFLKKVSLRNNGFARKIYPDSDAALQLKNFYKEVGSPLLSDVKFEYLPDQVEHTTTETKNLFFGSEILILGKIKSNSQSKLSGAVSAITPEGRKRFQFPTDIIILPPKEHNHTIGYLEKMWAYKTIKSLLDQNIVKKNDTIEEKAKKLALKYKFVTPLTSLVVIKPNVSSVVDDLPGGKHPIHLQYASGAPGMVLSAYYPKMPRYGVMQSILPIRPDSYYIARTGIMGMRPMLASGIHGPPAVGFSAYHTKLVGGHGPIMTTTPNFLTTVSEPETTEVPRYSKVPYTNVLWLNQTASEDGLFLQPPLSVDKHDVIALNETDVSTTKCSDGSDCRHFIYCTLDVFINNFKEYLPFKCHIEPKFLGVCCPHHY